MSVESAQGVVDEYDVTPDRKLLFSDFLGLVKKEVSKLESHDDSTWSAKVYRLSK